MPGYATRRQKASLLRVILRGAPLSDEATDDEVHAYYAAHPLPKLTEPRQAYVNHGRWVADCKMIDPRTGEECRGAELVALGEDFICGSCHQSSPVAFPTAKGRKEIDRLLGVRPPSKQNWNLDEDVAVLVGENIARGLEA